MNNQPLDYERIQEIIRVNKITENGIHYKSNGLFETDLISYNINNIKNNEWLFLEVLELIPVFFKNHISRKGVSSYTLKHIIERFLKDGYVDNATVIIAFIYLGYNYSHYRDPSPNLNIKTLFEPDISLLPTYIRKIKKSNS